VTGGDSAPGGAWFNPIAAFLGPAYLRNAFVTRSSSCSPTTQLSELLEA
jgi:hypothetical protein